VITWIFLRAAGIAAYLALFLACAWGLVSSTSLVTKRVSKKASTTFHASVATAGLAFLAIHLLLLVIDPFMPFAPLDLLLPMRASYRPVSIAFGIATMYGIVIVLASSWARKRMTTAWWRRLHLLAVPAFTLSLLHGAFAGTDGNRPWMFAMYAVTGLATLFLVIVRGLTVGYRPPRPEAPARARVAPTPEREPVPAD
jgi:sulfoxide reductase heme-binding subunit YedZ